MKVHVGTSGWSYGHWDGVLYPPATPARARLEHYVRRFGTVELNASFYRWPSPETFAGWQRRLPDGFQLSVKAPRGLTHARKLHDPEDWIRRITAGLHELGDKRGVFLVQLGPNQQRDDARLDYFLGLLPDWIRTAVEFRHPSWRDDQVFDLLERRGVAYCVMSGARLPCVLRATASWVYLRMHGPDPEHLYTGSYPRDSLEWWADRIREWNNQDREVYVYFDNDGEGNAVRDAETVAGYGPNGDSKAVIGVEVDVIGTRGHGPALFGVRIPGPGQRPTTRDRDTLRTRGAVVCKSRGAAVRISEKVSAGRH